MRLPTLALALAAATVVAAPVAAQTAATSAAPALREGMSIVTSEGGRVGRIVRVVTNEAGEAVAVSVIYRGAFIRIPVSTLTINGTRATTSLTTAELRAL
ncbi:hypothetical protein GV829_02335 [Sphingomonas lacunae]|uniref:PRC-barrel domain-containing protein n=1 Tax=Sphingomonas lacunae TaxID=2698828 RepID=A0A6M4AWT1_9SPHN|nr:hypothetical protein [Sphingomonas lacunae]QJQ31431.1 hypothetical protein GV829_02335 [Sphingomonas lacunae]